MKSNTAIIMDLDGTLALWPYRPSNFSEAVLDCVPNQEMRQVCLDARADGETVLFVTARPAHSYNFTATWLESIGLPAPSGHLYVNDMGASPSVYKRAIAESFILPSYQVRAAYDDDPVILALWSELGIPSFNPTQGEFIV